MSRMRLVPAFLACGLLALSAAAAAAQTPPQGDRYGPREPHAPQGAQAATPYAGPMLGWSRKVAATPGRPAGPVGPRRLPNGLYAGPGSAAVQVARAAPPSAPNRPAPRAAEQGLYGAAPQAPLPDSLYARPQAAAPQAAGPLPPPVRQNPYASSSPRFYSVYREYGGQPDAIPAPMPSATWVNRPEASLIEPFDPPRKKKKDDERMAAESDGDWGASSEESTLGSPE